MSIEKQDYKQRQCAVPGFLSKQFSLFEGRVDILHEENVREWKRYTGLDEDEMPTILRLKWDNELYGQAAINDLDEEADLDRKKERQEMWELLDKNKDGSITREEFNTYYNELIAEATAENCPLLIPREFVMVYNCEVPYIADNPYGQHVQWCNYGNTLDGVRMHTEYVDGKLETVQDTGTCGSKYGFSKNRETGPDGYPVPPGAPCITPCVEKRFASNVGIARRYCDIKATADACKQSTTKVVKNVNCRRCQFNKVKFYLNLFHVVRMSCVAKSRINKIINNLDEPMESLAIGVKAGGKEGLAEKRLIELENVKRSAQKLLPIIMNPITQRPFSYEELGVMRTEFNSIRNKWIEDNIVVQQKDTFRRVGVPSAQKVATVIGATVAVSVLAGSAVATAGVAPIVLGIIGATIWLITLYGKMRNIYLREQLISTNGSVDRVAIENFQLGWDVFIGGVTTLIDGIAAAGAGGVSASLSDANVKSVISGIQDVGKNSKSALQNLMEGMGAKRVENVMKYHFEENEKIRGQMMAAQGINTDKNIEELIDTFTCLGYHYNFQEAARVKATIKDDSEFNLLTEEEKATKDTDKFKTESARKLQKRRDGTNTEGESIDKNSDNVHNISARSTELSQEIFKSLNSDNSFNVTMLGKFDPEINLLVRVADEAFMRILPLNEDFLQNPKSLAYVEKAGLDTENSMRSVDTELQNIITDTINKAKREGRLEGGSMYNKIVNPITGRKVSINGKLGKKILKKYIKMLR